jgi:ABC-type glycerol-3-phosphate transport system substrate-binding protein
MRYRHALALLLIVGSLTGGCAIEALPAGPRDLTAGPTERTPPTTAPANPTLSTDGRVTITFAADNRPGFQPLIETFEKDNPDIHVQFVELEGLMKPVQLADGSMIMSPYLAMREILSGADTVAAGVTTEAIRKGWARDLAPFMEADPTFDREDFYPGTLAAGSYDGKIYLLPRAQYVTLLAYNKALWSARGIPAPRPDWTWVDVKAAAAQLARKRNGTVEVYGLAEWHPGERAIRSELEAAGVDLLATPIEQLRLDEAAIEDALTRVAAMVESGVLYLHPQGSRFDPDATAQLIRDQRVGIWMTGMDFVDRSKPAFKIGLAASPFESVSVDGYLMSSGAQHPEHAWRWLAFLSRQLISPPPDFVSMGVEVPARRSIAAQRGDVERLDAETRAVIQAMLSRRMRTSPRGLEDENDRALLLLTQALNAIVIGRQPVRIRFLCVRQLHAVSSMQPAGRGNRAPTRQYPNCRGAVASSTGR